jgi:protein arginine kinase
MLHLPGISMLENVEEVLNLVHPYGLTARGFYGENTEFTGDFYQISNEVSLGKSEEEITSTVQRVVEQLVQKEEQAREQLFNQARRIDDAIWRAYAALSNARLMNSSEAMKLLSTIRLGVVRGYFSNLKHSDLNKLVLQIQPAHLQHSQKKNIEAEERDYIRAELLRNRFQDLSSNN